MDRTLLGAYPVTPGTSGRVRRADRLLADQLYDRRVPMLVAQHALAFAAARRLSRPADALPVAPIRSLAYFVSVIDELFPTGPDPDHFLYLRHKLQHLLAQR
ncbi:MAG: hypothetical protein ACXW36_10200 [Nitrospira sp.]